MDEVDCWVLLDLALGGLAALWFLSLENIESALVTLLLQEVLDEVYDFVEMLVLLLVVIGSAASPSLYVRDNTVG